jgi:fibronectin-binding autotransporter adhesin
VRQVADCRKSSVIRASSLRRKQMLGAACATAVALGFAGTASAAIFSYTPTNSNTDVWSAGTDWNNTPVSAVTTELSFVSSNATVLAGGLNNTNTDDITGNFQLNILDLQGTGPASGGAASITIAASGSTLNFITNGTTAPVINLNANAGASALTYNVTAPISLSNDTTFVGSGTATFSFQGVISGAGGLIFNTTGTSGPTLTAQNTFTGAVTVNGGTVYVNGGNTGTGTLGSSSSITVNNGGTISIIGGDNSFVGSGAFNGGRTITINAGGVITSLASLSGHLGSLVLAGGTLATTGAIGGTVPTFGSFDLDHTVTAGGTAATSTLSALDMALSQGGGTIFNVSSGASNGVDLSVTGTFFHGSGIGDNGLIKQGNGVMSLSGANTYTSATTVNGGTLLLDFSGVGAPANNIVNNATNSSALVLGSGTLSLNGSTTTADTQSFNGATLSGAGKIVLVSHGNPLLLTLGTMTRSGGIVDFTLPAGPQNATNGVVITGGSNTNGILPGATVGGNNFASVTASGNIVPFAGPFTDIPSGGLIPNVPAANARITGGFPGAYTLVSGATSINSLLQNTAGVVTLNTTGATLNVGSVLLPSGAGPMNIGNSPGAGNLTAGSGGPGELILDNNSTNPLTVYSTIVDNGSGATSLTAGGTGPVVLAAPNTFTGTVGAGGAGLVLTNSLAIQNATIQGGNLVFSSSVLSKSFTGGSLKGSGPLVLQNDAGAGITLTFGGNNQSNTFSGVISGPGGLVKTGSGVETLTVVNSFSGGLTVAAGTVITTTGGGSSALGTGPVTVNTGAVLQGNGADSFGFTPGAPPTVININGGTVTEGSGAFRITLPNIAFLNGGTLGNTNGNTGDANGNYSLNGGTVTVNASANTAVINAPTVSLQAGTVTFNVARGTAATDLLVSSVLSSFTSNGAQNLLKTGNGIMTLTAQNTYGLLASATSGGSTIVNGGTLVTDFSAAGAPTANITNPNAPLQLGGGAVLVKGNASNGVSETFNVVGVNLGASAIDVASAGTQDVFVSLSFIGSRALGGTVDFVPPANASTGTNGINLAFGAADNGIIGGFATVKGADWATTDGNTNIVALTSYTDVVGGGTITDDGTTNVRLNGGTATLQNNAAGGTTSINSLLQKQNAPASSIDTGGGTLNIGGATSAFGAPGGVLQAPGAGTLTIGLTPDSGSIIAASGSPGAELVFINNSANPLVINSTLVDSGTAGAVTVSGSGVTELLGTNTYTGQTSIVGGTLQVGNGGTTGKLGSGTVVDLTNLTFDRSDNVTVGTVLTGAGTVTKIAGNALTLSGNNTFTGGLIINAGTVISTTSSGNSGLGAGPVNVNAGTTLQGNAQDAFGFTAGVSPPVININGGTVTEGAGTGTTPAAYRVTLPNLVFSNGGTLTNPTGTAGNNGDGNGNYSFFGGTVTVNASSTGAVISATRIGIQANPVVFNVARGSAASDLTVSSVLSDFGGSHGIIFNGSGITTLSANNSFSGGLVINGGTVISTTSGGATAIGAGNVTVNPGATLQGNAGDSFGFSGGASPAIITINGGTVTEGGGSGSTPAAYRITIRNLVFSNGGTLTNPTGTAGNNGDANGNYSLFGGNVTVNPSATTALINATKVGLQAGTLTFNVARGAATSDLTINSVLAQFGTTSVLKTGTGVMTLNGANTYTAPTSVNGGTLLVNNTSGNGAVNVNTAGTLAGIGTIGGALNVNAGGTVSAGDAYSVPGTLTVAGVTTLATGSGIVGDAGNGATYLWKINNAGPPAGTGTAGSNIGWDKLAVTTVSLGGTGSFVTLEPVSVGGGFVNGAIANFSPTTPYQWTIATLSGGGGTVLGAQMHFDTNALSAFAAANNALASNFSVTDDANDVYISYSPAPEPTSLGLLGLGAGSLLLRRRRRSTAAAMLANL